MLDSRKIEMAATRRNLRKEFLRITQPSKWSETFDSIVFKLPNKKFNHFGLRSYFAQTIYGYIVDQAKEEKYLIKKINNSERIFKTIIPLISEIIICIQYYHNQILDGKGGVRNNKDALDNNLLSANLLRTLLNKYIRDEFTDSNTCLHVLNTVDNIFELVDIGQLMDKEWGTYEQFRNHLSINTILSKNVNNSIPNEEIQQILNEIIDLGLSKINKRYTENYLKRIYLTNSILYVYITKLIMDILSYHGKERKSIIRFVGFFSLSTQIVNDNIDIIEAQTIAKVKEDAFSDIRNNTMTLPLIYYFSKNHLVNITDLQNELSKSKLSLFEKIHPFIENYSKKIGKNCADKAILELNQTNNYYEILKDITLLASENRYYELQSNIKLDLSRQRNWFEIVWGKWKTLKENSVTIFRNYKTNLIAVPRIEYK